MKITIIGHRGYIGQNIKNSINHLGIEKLYLIDRNTLKESFIRYISDSDIVIHCGAIQRPAKNEIDSFLPNLILTKQIVDNLPNKTKLIFLSSIHFNSNTPFGLVRKMEEDYIVKHLELYTIYHLPYTYGPYGKPDYNNFFNTIIINVIKNKEVSLNDFHSEFSILSINEFMIEFISNLDKSLNIVNDFTTHNTTLPNFFNNVININNGVELDAISYEEIKSVYDWYKMR